MTAPDRHSPGQGALTALHGAGQTTTSSHLTSEGNPT